MEFTGERFLPEMDIDSEIAIFHYQRYQSMVKICTDKIVLDIACGEGYGTHLLASTAKAVYGVDIDGATVAEAVKKYKRNNLAYAQGTVENLEFQDAMFDIVISFETIEHIDASIQKKFIKEVRRVLKKDGLFVISSPDKHNYSEIPAFTNKFHVHELYYDEFAGLLKSEFQCIEAYYQGRMCNSYIFSPGKSIAQIHTEIKLRDADITQAEYIIAVCANREITEDIKSVVCDANNQYYKMNRELIQLKKVLGSPGDIIQQKENYIIEQRGMIESKDARIREINGIVEQKENYIQEQREVIAKRDREIREQQGIIEQKENYICEQREAIAYERKEAREQQGIIEQKENYICEQRNIIEQKENRICEQRKIIEEKEKELDRQRERLNVYETFINMIGIRTLYNFYTNFRKK